ncbi:formate dehydrogenase accessory sulfurtransferase FdhD [Nitrogeniibacter aestuarii]|uniref:formate dehydrogenase accessory sulfurtransferase FdhD n=1 Tax=Nitrogeniibacter aestuarii TaxID=2815343 RepID=UPI001E449496|nr:formate dehydrogenase accessory sulfurtransferase FdhD [Nitrogeniibacter aestuarii]
MAEQWLDAATHIVPADAPDRDNRSLVRAYRWTHGERIDSVECLIEEVPVALVYNGVSHAVMLASPSDLDDFALGFSLAEGILASPDELFDIEIEHGCRGIEVQMRIHGQRFAGLKARRRALAGRTGCGLCGVESLEAAERRLSPVRRGAPVGARAVVEAVEALYEHQELHRATRAAHAAAWATPSGEIVRTREDVGRHNALDKLIGALAREGIDVTSGFAVVTSRASVEMVQKAASAGIGLLAAVSAPTGMAVGQAQLANLTLIGNARHGRLTCYSHPDGLIDD